MIDENVRDLQVQMDKIMNAMVDACDAERKIHVDLLQEFRSKMLQIRRQL